MDSLHMVGMGTETVYHTLNDWLQTHFKPRFEEPSNAMVEFYFPGSGARVQ